MKSTSRDFTAKEFEALITWWTYTKRQRDLLQSFLPALEALKSEYVKTVNHTIFENLYMDWTADIIERIAEDADIMMFAHYHELKKYQLRRKAGIDERFL